MEDRGLLHVEKGHALRGDLAEKKSMAEGGSKRGRAAAKGQFDTRDSRLITQVSTNLADRRLTCLF